MSAHCQRCGRRLVAENAPERECRCPPVRQSVRMPVERAHELRSRAAQLRAEAARLDREAAVLVLGARK